MGQSLPTRNRRRKLFLRALAAGRPVAEACEAANVPRANVYRWRHSDRKFRAAWDRAASLGAEAVLDQLNSALIDRACDGVEVPVYYKGNVVGTRRRYSDALLLYALREINERRALAEARASAPAAPEPRVRVVMEPLPGEGAPQEQR
jgi:hypothetical protein